MEDFVIKNGVLKAYTGKSAKVMIPDTVRSIGCEAFEGNTAIQQVSVPSSVKKIGEYAFARCTNLKKIILREGLETVEEFAFFECASLETVVFPATTTQFNGILFDGCKNLKTVTVKGNIQKMAYDAFWYCNKETFIHFPNQKTKMRYGPDCMFFAPLICIRDMSNEMKPYAAAGFAYAMEHGLKMKETDKWQYIYFIRQTKKRYYELALRLPDFLVWLLYNTTVSQEDFEELMTRVDVEHRARLLDEWNKSQKETKPMPY